MSIFSKLFGSGKNPADVAMPYLNQIPGVAKEQFNPYIQQGTQARNVAQPQYDRMTENPMGFLDEIMRGYKPSAGFDFRKEQAQKALASTAASGGFRGTDFHNSQNLDLIDKILSQGQGEHLDQVLRILGGGLQGQEAAQTRGFGASSSLADMLGNTLGSQAGLAYKGQENKNATRGQWMKLLGQLVGATGGAVLGGPAGAQVGANIGGTLGGGGTNNSQQFGSNLFRGGLN